MQLPSRYFNKVMLRRKRLARRQTETIEAPVNTALPEITGDLFPNSILTVSDGEWDNEPTSFAYQWYVNDEAVVGAEENTYNTGAVSTETVITATVTATNAGGSTPATSDPVEIVYLVSAPTINAAPVIGVAASVTPAVWSDGGSPDSYVWQSSATGSGDGDVVAGMTAIDSVYPAETFGLYIRVGAVRAGLDTAWSAWSAAQVVFQHLEDTFTGTLAAGAVNGTLSDSGHTRTVVDAESKLTLGGGKAVFAGGKAVPAWGDPGINYPIDVFSEGRALDITLTANSAVLYNARFGFRSGVQAFVDLDILTNSNVSFTAVGGGSIARAASTEYDLRLVSTAEWTFAFIRGGAYTDWRLFDIARKAAPSNVYPAVTNNSGIFDVSRLVLRDIDGWEDVHTAHSASGTDVLAGSADGFILFTWQPLAAETLNLYVRRTDDDNAIIIRCDQAGGTIKVIKRESGVETELDSDAQTWTPTAGTQYTIVIVLNETSIVTRVNDVAKSSTTSSYNQAVTGVKASGFTYGRDLYSYPLTLSDSVITYALNRPPLNVLYIGDSKTAGSTTAPYNSFAPFLSRMINAREVPAAIAQGGRQTSQLYDIIDAQLAAAVGTPDYVVYNMGRNDIGSSHATWQTHTAYILDAIHTKWPDAHVYVARVWAADDTADAWLQVMDDTDIPAVLASRSAWAHLGIDERITLEGGNDGARYSSDGTHYNREGYLAIARAWKVAMGL